jgi:hypothetical protein
MEITTEIKAILISVAATALAMGFLWYGHSRYNAGAAAVKAADAAAFAKQVATDTKAVEAASHAQDTELASLRAYVAAHPLPTVSVCSIAASAPAAAAKAPSSTGPARPGPAPVQPVPAGNPAVQPDRNSVVLGMLSSLAESADAVSAQLRAHQSL